MLKTVCCSLCLFLLFSCSTTTPEKIVSPLTFEELHKECYNTTSAQFDQVNQNLKGKYITWQGEVTDVEFYTHKNGYSYGSIDVDMGTTFYNFNLINQSNSVSLKTQKTNDDLLALSKGDIIKYTGKVAHVINYTQVYGFTCSVTLEDWSFTKLSINNK